LPNFNELPMRPGDPPHSAWGLYGDEDQTGTLNRLTDEVVAKAASDEIRNDWHLDAQKVPSFNRQAFHKNVIHKAPRIVNDDVWTFNTQSSTQWDGLRHFAYQKEKKFYNGVTLDDIHANDETTINGVHVWAQKGIVGRGILLDFRSWSLENGIEYNPFKTGSISLQQMWAVLKAQGTEVRFGDILFIRSGYIDAYNRLDQSQINDFASVMPPHFSGVEQSLEVLEWIWNNFAAVAGDQPSFECWREFEQLDPCNFTDRLPSDPERLGSA
ncbi:MAG: hypothetical protein Q9174_006734, partial [Haloplaca sp. 1 TL-2023]